MHDEVAPQLPGSHGWQIWVAAHILPGLKQRQQQQSQSELACWYRMLALDSRCSCACRSGVAGIACTVAWQNKQGVVSHSVQTVTAHVEARGVAHGHLERVLLLEVWQNVIVPIGHHSLAADLHANLHSKLEEM